MDTALAIITAPESPELSLPGSIPGLVRRCSPGWCGTDKLTVGLVLGDGGLIVHVLTPDCDDWCDAMERKDFALDLVDTTGRQHAAAWLGERYAVNGCTGAMWSRVADERPTGPIWLLGGTPRGSTVRFAAHPPDHPGNPRRFDYVAVPALAGLDLADHRLLPDGTRYLDALALKLAVLCVANLPTEG